jgi:hypothetical protein
LSPVINCTSNKYKVSVVLLQRSALVIIFLFGRIADLRSKLKKTNPQLVFLVQLNSSGNNYLETVLMANFAVRGNANARNTYILSAGKKIIKDTRE